MRYLIFADQHEAQAWCDRIDTALGYPDEATKTTRYTEPVVHADGRAAVVVMPWLETRLGRLDQPLLADGETADQVDELTPDWWPDEDEE